MKLPLRQKSREGWQKYLLRKSMSPLLDEQIVWHRKRGHLGWALVRRLMYLANNPFEEVFETSKSTGANFVDVEILKDMFSHWRTTGDERELYKLYSASSLLLWLRRKFN
jgi:hypothetical protein